MTRIYLQKTPQGQVICDALMGKILSKALDDEEALQKAFQNGFEPPAFIHGGPLLKDPEGRPLYWSKPFKSGEKEYHLEYADGTLALDVTPCPRCKGVAFPRITEHGEKNCYVCTHCNYEVACVPDREVIGELD